MVYQNFDPHALHGIMVLLKIRCHGYYNLGATVQGRRLLRAAAINFRCQLVRATLVKGRHVTPDYNTIAIVT